MFQAAGLVYELPSHMEVRMIPDITENTDSDRTEDLVRDPVTLKAEDAATWARDG